MNASLPEVKALSLYEAEHELLDFFDDDEDERELSPEEEAALQAELAERLQYAIDKRESFGLFLLFLTQQTDLAKREIVRLRRRIDRIEALDARLRRYAVAAIRSLGTDNKGKFRKLVGHTITLFVRALPSSVSLYDEGAVPYEFKRLTVQMPATLWENLCLISPELADCRITDVYIDKDKVRTAIENNREVPGADLKMSGHDHSLVVK